MNILYIHQHFATREGKTATASYDYAKYLVSHGHKVTVIAGRNYRSHWPNLDDSKLIQITHIEGIDIILINIDYSNYMGFFRRILAFVAFMFVSGYVVLKQKKLDLIFVTSPPLTTGVTGLIASKVKSVPFVFQVMDLWPDFAVVMGSLKNKFLISFSRFWESVFYKHAKLIVVISNGIKNVLLEKGIPEDKIVVVYLGADLTLLSFEDESDSGFRRAYELDNKFIVIFAGTHGKANGLEVVIKAADELKKRGEEDVRFILIGEGSEKQRLMEQASALHLNNVLFFAPVPKKEISKILASSDLGLMVLKNIKIFETACPNKFFDYLVFGKPILFNFGGEIKEMLESESAGVFVEPNNPKSMVEMILKLKDNPEWLRKMGKNARVLAERFDRMKMATKLEEAFYKVFNDTKTR
jgi:glycosyltransferase involved in cell wall biosynthesis